MTMRVLWLGVLPALAIACSSGAASTTTSSDAGGSDGSQADAADIAGQPTATVDTKPPKDYPLGFVGLVTGPTAVIDLKTFSLQATIGTGHFNVHGTGPLPGQKVVWVGNTDGPSIDRYEMQNDDPKQWKQTKSVPTCKVKPDGVVDCNAAPAFKAEPLQLGVMHIARNGSLLAATDGIVPLDGSLLPKDPTKVGLYVTLFDPNAGQWLGAVPVSPSFAVQVNADGSKVYAGNWFANTVTVIDPKSQKVSAIWPLPMPAGTPAWGGPSGLQLSHDEKWLASGGWDGKVIHLLDAQTGAAQKIEVDGLAHWAAFSADDKTLFMSVFAYLPIAGSESENVNIPSYIAVIDMATMKMTRKLKWDHFVGHCGVPPGGSQIYVTASFGTLLRFDVGTGQLTGAVQAYSGLPMPASIPSF